MRFRLIAPVLLVIAVTAGAFALTLAEAKGAAWLVLAGGLVLAAVTATVAATAERRRRAVREVDRFFTLSPEMVIVAGFDGYWKRVNPTVEAVLGYTEREALSRPFMEFVHPDDRERTEEEARRVVAGETALAFENRIVCKNGSYRWIEWTVTPVPEDGVMYGIGRDVTERRRSESEQAALRRAATLVAEGAAPGELFAAVADEVAAVLGVSSASVSRFLPDGFSVVLASLNDPGFPIGSRWRPDEGTLNATILATGRPVRIDQSAMSGPIAEASRVSDVRSVVGVPIVVESSVWGMVAVGRQHSDDPLPADTEVRLTDFTELIATAIANAQARDDVLRLADEQATLRRVATLVAQGVLPAELFSAVTKEVAHVFSRVEPSLLASVIRFDPGPECVLVGASRSYELEPIGSRWSPKELYVSTRVLRTGRSARIDKVDLDSLGGTDADVLRLRGFLYQVGSPVVVEGRLWGAMTLNSGEALPPDTDERLEGFTELVATAIANAEARDSLRRLADEQAGLRRVATLVAEGTAPTDLFSAVAVEAAAVVGVSSCTVSRFLPDGFSVVLASHNDPGFPVGSRWRTDEGNLSAAILEAARPARVDQKMLSGPIAEAARISDVRSAVGAPIVVEGRVWGMVAVGRQHSDEPLPPQTETRLAAFTELIATAIANADSGDALARLADEQAALRRVATLVARDAPSAEVFEAVANEVGKLLDTDITIVGRYDSDGAATAIGNWSSAPGGVPVGTRSVLGGRNVLTMVAETGKPARLDEYEDASGEAAEIARRHGWRSSIAAPIVVEGRLWGVMLVATRRPERFPAGAEDRLAGFTELIATAIGNARAHDEVRRFGDEQATLRRIAILVAKGVQPQEVFAAVTEEVAATFRAIATVLRFWDDPPGVVLAGASKEIDIPIGTRWDMVDALAAEDVYRTGRSARVNREQWSSAVGPIGEAVRRLGIVSTVATPIIVEGTRWGVITVNGREELPPDTEQRLEKFTELVTTAISNAASRVAISRLAEEQAALRRVATLVAQGTSPHDLFEAVAEEVGRLLLAANVSMGRYEGDGSLITSMASWSSAGPTFPTGERWPTKGTSVAWMVLQTGRSARIDDFSAATDPIGVAVREAGYKSAVGSPIVVEGRLWGVISAASSEGSMPPGTEARLASFTELVATAIANAEGSAELAASRRRIVAASDDARRRIERDLHDGTQQRLVSLGLAVRAAEADVPSEQQDLHDELSRVAQGLAEAVEDLQEISRGIHPAILSKGGLGPTLRTLAHRSAIPVDLEITTDARLEEPIEVAAYYVASEALANAAKHSQASRIDVSLGQRDGNLVLSIRDDGVGGADAAHGSGLVGLTDRVEALGGSIRVASRPGEGTQIRAELPLAG